MKFAFVKRIETPASRLAKPENIKGICAHAATARLYFTTLTRLYCPDPHPLRLAPSTFHSSLKPSQREIVPDNHNLRR